jgi:hypothetical protein
VPRPSRPALAVALLCAAGVLAACGDGATEDSAEDFEVDVLKQEFPEVQKLARTSVMTIEVENIDTRTIPDIGVTVEGFDYELTDPGDPDLPDPDVADPARPQFVVNRSPVEYLTPTGPDTQAEERSLVDEEVEVPYGRGTDFVGTYTLGELPAGESAQFRWDVTAVQAGPYELTWRVVAGTSHDLNAVGTDGQPVEGSFSGKVSDAQVKADIARDGKSIITDDGRRIDY